MDKKKIEQETERLKEIISTNIKRLMKFDGCSGYQLQKEHGINPSTLYKIIRKEMMPSVYLIVQFSEIFDVSIEWMVTDHECGQGD